MQEIVLFSHWLFKLALQLLRGDFILLKYIHCLLSKHVILFILSGFFFFAIKELIHLRGNKNSLEYLQSSNQILKNGPFPDGSVIEDLLASEGDTCSTSGPGRPHMSQAN